MKNWLRNKIRNFLEEPENRKEQRSDLGALVSNRVIEETPSLSSRNDPLQFAIYDAAGGKVVEVRHYDRKRDTQETRLHIITSDEDFGKSIAEILMLENISR